MNLKNRKTRQFISCSCSFDFKYDLFFSENIFNTENYDLLYGRSESGGKAFLIVDEAIFELYIDQIKKFYDHHKIYFKVYVFPSGEFNKSIECYLDLMKSLNEFQINRRSEPLVVIGGGITTDVAAFVSSTFRRGVPHIKVPTTLMGYVDASIGIKNGVNFEENKNRVGSFYPPIAVFLDDQFLNTLNYRDVCNGVGEVLKMAVIKNKTLFSLLEEEGRSCIEKKFQSCGREILELSITGMLEELQKNFYELDLERIVDFGHTFSPAIEMKDKKLLHGEAVVIDIAFSSFLAEQMGVLNCNERKRILKLIEMLGLPNYSPELNVNLLWGGLVERTYHRDGLQRAPLPKGIGDCVFFNNITIEDIESSFEKYKSFILDCV